MDFFTWVSDFSGWYWLALGILLVAIEMLMPTFVLIWPGFAAVIMAILVAIFPDIRGEWLITIFAVLSIGLTFAGRGISQRLRKSEPVTTLNSRADAMVGRNAKVVSFDNGEGKVTVSGVQWPAFWEDGEIAAEGQTVIIASAKGVSLMVKNV